MKTAIKSEAILNMERMAEQLSVENIKSELIKFVNDKRQHINVLYGVLLDVLRTKINLDEFVAFCAHLDGLMI